MAKKGYGYFYFIDDNGSLQMRKLTGRKRKQVLINYLRRRSGREMKVESIAKAFNVSVRSMQKILKELEEESFIRRERMYDEGGKQRANRIIYIGERPRLTGAITTTVYTHYSDEFYLKEAQKVDYMQLDFNT